MREKTILTGQSANTKTTTTAIAVGCGDTPQVSGPILGMTLGGDGAAGMPRAGAGDQVGAGTIAGDLCGQDPLGAPGIVGVTAPAGDIPRAGITHRAGGTPRAITTTPAGLLAPLPLATIAIRARLPRHPGAPLTPHPEARFIQIHPPRLAAQAHPR